MTKIDFESKIFSETKETKIRKETVMMENQEGKDQAIQPSGVRLTPEQVKEIEAEARKCGCVTCRDDLEEGRLY